MSPTADVWLLAKSYYARGEDGRPSQDLVQRQHECLLQPRNLRSSSAMGMRLPTATCRTWMFLTTTRGWPTHDQEAGIKSSCLCRMRKFDDRRARHRHQAAVSGATGGVMQVTQNRSGEPLTDELPNKLQEGCSTADIKSLRQAWV